MTAEQRRALQFFGWRPAVQDVRDWHFGMYIRQIWWVSPDGLMTSCPCHAEQWANSVIYANRHNRPFQAFISTPHTLHTPRKELVLSHSHKGYQVD